MYTLIVSIVAVIIPNVNTAVDTGMIQQYDVTVFAYEQTPTLVAGAATIHEYAVLNTIRFISVGGTVGVDPPNAALLAYGDILSPATLEDYAWLYHYSGEPYVSNTDFPRQDFYIGLFEPDAESYAWIQVKYLGGILFEQVRSAVAYDGESLIVGYTYGDFDLDGDTDGRDFLVWQRDTTLPLVEWQASYIASLTATPEPTTIVMLLMAFCILTMKRV